MYKMCGGRMYTKEDLKAVERAILDLMLGKRVTTVHYGDMQVQYALSDLDDLKQLKALIADELNEGSGIRRVIFATDKGLR